MSPLLKACAKTKNAVRTVIASLLIAGLFTAAIDATRAASPSPPNVVIFYIDDMSEGLLSCYGGDLVSTPNIDALAGDGVRFTQGYVTACMCGPSRVGLMTGRYQQRFGHDGNYRRQSERIPDPVLGMDPGQTTFAQHMRDAGYATGIAGKWHLGHDPGYLPVSRGFDFSFGSVENLGFNKGTRTGAGNFFRGDDIIVAPGWLVTSPMYAEEAARFIEANRAQPFFLYVSFNAVHAPAVSSDHWKQRLAHLDPKLINKAAQVAELDEAIGTVMKTLRDTALETNTLIFCIADNGRQDYSGGLNGLAGSNGLRGDKWTLWEAGIRVPWIVQWKGRIPGGRVIDEPVIQLDVLPTALAAVGTRAAEIPRLDGVNLLPLLEGATDQLDREALYWRVASRRKGVTQFAIRQGDWKLVKATEDDPTVLVNLAEDRGELTDLSGAHPERVQALRAQWDRWNSTMKPPAW